MPYLSTKHVLALKSCSNVPLFSASLQSSDATEPLSADLIVLTTCSQLQHKRDVLYAKGKPVLYEALDLEELGDAITKGLCRIQDCKFLIGKFMFFSSFTEGLSNRSWLPVVPISPTSMAGYRVNGQSLAIAGVDTADYEEYDHFQHAFWAEVVGSVTSGPGFQWLARYPVMK